MEDSNISFDPVCGVGIDQIMDNRVSKIVCYPLESLGDQLAHGQYMAHSQNNCLEAIIKHLFHSTTRV